MDSVDLQILKYCSTADNYDSIKGSIDRDVCVKESWVLLQAFDKYYELGADIIDKDFKTWFRIRCHPEFKKENHILYGRIIDNVLAEDMPDSVGFHATINKLRNQSTLESVLSEYKRGRLSDDDLASELSVLSKVPSGGDVVATGIDPMELAEHARTGGLYWRLEDLNKSVGPVAGGDFILIGKRPEVGGTSFLCSEMTFMLSQLPAGGRALIFNNEEEVHKVKSRVVSAALGIDYLRVMSDPAATKESYEKWQDEREMLVIHDTQMTIHSIERAIQEYKPTIIGINVLLKVGGIDRKEDHDKLEQLGVHLRAMSDDYGAPIFGVVQADPQADGVKYIPQTWIYKSKTALQGEADVLIMIGTDEEGNEEDRYIHVAKNKIPPSECTDITCKHIKSHVKFDVATGRFTSRNWKTHSMEKGYVYTGD